MTAAAVETLLARLHADESLRAAFLADRESVVKEFDLTGPERESVLAIDDHELVVAARAAARKRAHREATGSRSHAAEVFLVFLRLGLTSFGGPVAHIGYFRDEFVNRRHWLTERSYADIVSLCQFLPGPASSQVGMAVGLSRAGYAGALAAWAGFTLPSALAMIVFALGVSAHRTLLSSGMLHGLKVVAVAVVAQAVWGMGRSLCSDRARVTLMAAAAGAALLFPGTWTQVAVIALAGFAGLALFEPPRSAAHDPLPVPIGPRAGLAWLAAFFALLAILPPLAAASDNRWLAVIDAFYRSGSLVFGGGHVVLPLLQSETVPRGWVGEDAFLAGYGAAQAVPGPLFTFAAYLGAVVGPAPNGLAGAGLGLVGIFLPGLLIAMPIVIIVRPPAAIATVPTTAPGWAARRWS